MLDHLPTVNAALNGLALLLLLGGWSAIKTGRKQLHKQLMLSALAASATFLACYLYYHYQVGSKKFPGTGWVKGVYFAILVPHILLAVVMLPPIFRTLFLAHRERFDEHRRIARWTLPVWLYVSLTGVLVYLMLYVWYKPA